jgi:hypothetical protein
VNPPLVIDNKMAVEADPGPFKLAAAEKLEAFGPVLVVLPDNGFVDVVLVELSHFMCATGKSLNRTAIP